MNQSGEAHMDASAVETIYSTLATASCVADARGALQRFTTVAEHDYFICDFVAQDDANCNPFTVHNYPGSWLDRASRVPQALYDRDPVFAHLNASPVPILWSQLDYAQAGALEVWEEAAAAGISAGVAVAVECARGFTLRLGLSRDSARKISATEAVDLRAHLSLFSACLKARVVDLFIPEIRKTLPHLTVRELDALRWTREGKTAWEMGKILGISNGTANFHLQNAQRKLASSDKHQAVLRALELRLIE